MRLSHRGALCASVAIALAACSGDAPTATPTGSIEVTTTTTGHDLDADGYSINLDGGAVQPIPVNGTYTFTDVATGVHQLVATGTEPNCSFDSTSVSIAVTAGSTARHTLHISCRRLVLRNVIMFTSEEFGLPEVFSMNPDGSERERITADQLGYAHPSLSPDGRRIVFSSKRTGTWGIYLMDADGAHITPLVSRSTFDGSPAWSPDGTTIAFRSENPGPSGSYGRIFLINIDGTGLRQLTPDTTTYVYDDDPAWSPDGTKILFDRSGRLFTIHPDASGLTAINTGPGIFEYAAWSPDGTKISAAVTVDTGTTHLSIMNADGSNVVRLTTYGGQESGSTWSPDGTQLVFERVIDHQFQLFRIDADGTGEIKLSATPKSEGFPTWSWAK